MTLRTDLSKCPRIRSFPAVTGFRLRSIMLDFVGLDGVCFGRPCILCGNVYMDIHDLPKFLYVYEYTYDISLSYEFTTLTLCHTDPSKRRAQALIFVTSAINLDEEIDGQYYAIVGPSLSLTGTASKLSSFLKREMRRMSKGGRNEKKFQRMVV